MYNKKSIQKDSGGVREARHAQSKAVRFGTRPRARRVEKGAGSEGGKRDPKGLRESANPQRWSPTIERRRRASRAPAPHRRRAAQRQSTKGESTIHLEMGSAPRKIPGPRYKEQRKMWQMEEGVFGERRTAGPSWTMPTRRMSDHAATCLEKNAGSPLELKSMQCYKIKTQDKIKPQDAQAATRQGKTQDNQNSRCTGGQAKTSHREPSFFVPTLKILVPPVLHRNQSATISRDVRFQLNETVDGGFQQEVDEVIDENAAASGRGEGSGVRAATMTRFSCICVGRIIFFFLSNAR
ncbi:hypothetical protein C8J57DRAFT_1231006 [Mycena rebaudengoi]|nr:hypothetical protein C8J57DRAFT_1231006 [Mycena rebaudengoi]